MPFAHFLISFSAHLLCECSLKERFTIIELLQNSLLPRLPSRAPAAKECFSRVSFSEEDWVQGITLHPEKGVWFSSMVFVLWDALSQKHFVRETGFSWCNSSAWFYPLRKNAALKENSEANCTQSSGRRGRRRGQPEVSFEILFHFSWTRTEVYVFVKHTSSS